MNSIQPLNQSTSFTVEFPTALTAGLLSVLLSIFTIVTIVIALSRAL